MSLVHFYRYKQRDWDNVKCAVDFWSAHIQVVLSYTILIHYLDLN